MLRIMVLNWKRSRVSSLIFSLPLRTWNRLSLIFHPSSFRLPLWSAVGFFARMWVNRVHSASAIWFLACLEVENGSQDSQPQRVT